MNDLLRHQKIQINKGAAHTKRISGIQEIIKKAHMETFRIMVNIHEHGVVENEHILFFFRQRKGRKMNHTRLISEITKGGSANKKH